MQNSTAESGKSDKGKGNELPAKQLDQSVRERASTQAGNFPQFAVRRSLGPAIIVIGASLGGLQALQVILSGLPSDFSVPIAITQHRYKDSGKTLSAYLQRYSTLPVVEAEDKAALLPGHIYLAPADYHLLIDQDSLALSTEAPVAYARPSIDMLFESAADAYTDRVIGVILTGASHDGAKGLAKIKSQGGLALIQEPATAESPTMPAAALEAVAADWVLQLSDIAPLLVNLCQLVPR